MTPYLWSIIGAIQGAYSAAASTFLASFPTPAFAATLSMASNLITNLAKATAVGHAIRYEALGSGTFPSLADWTSDLAANVTRTAATETDRGLTIVHTLAAAATRLSTEYRTGTSIVLQARFISPGVTEATTVLGFVCVALSRPATDNVKVSFNLGPSALGAGTCFRAFRWTDKDTYGTALIAVPRPVGAFEHAILRARLTGGNVEFAYSIDGTTFMTLYTDTVANAFGGAGNPTRVEFGTILQANGQVGHVIAERVDVS